ncbi:efflux RND transporter periplasmic adaptor subunit [Thiohalorhabdus denitrificans]|uniref:RND family efflux transporter, MFP subunit n=1 Tax=Thiohalorhabdus denitrificans TaxID=381306 RepID=A0A1G5BZ50_9GAMM|nr:efflux RND transporter periplasmic adaptor subunit [Thiohalorhabdus denitrificans]SCX95475.1 RND family efflux transporter, MFP subunit [Thiohalorhabdus denitrificans]
MTTTSMRIGMPTGMAMTTERFVRRLGILLPGLLAVLLAACDGDSGHSHGGEEGGHDHAAEDGGAAVPERPSRVVTRFNDATELFVEYPVLVAGKTSRLAAHLTWLDGYKPVDSGRLTVTLNRDGKMVAGFRVGRPTRDGLYTPEVKPREPGVFTMVLTWEEGDRRTVHRLEGVRVHASRAEVPEDQSGSEEGEITFLKEQQWRLPFGTAVATKRRLRATVPATGTLRAAPSGDRRVTAPVPGRLEAPEGGFPEAGQQVAAGEVLARIVPRLGTGTDLATLRLAVTEAESEFRMARRERRRLEGLLAKDAVSERRVAEARSRARVARARLEAARQRLAAYQPEKGEGDGPAGVPVLAGAEGRVAELRATPGTSVREGDDLMRVVDRRRLWLVARVPEAEASRLPQPTGAWVTPTGQSRALKVDTAAGARLLSAGQTVDPATRTVPVTFALPNPGDLRAGTSAAVRVWTGEATKALAVPKAAVQREAGEAVVYVQAGGESFARRPVTLGMQDGDYVAVTSGLAPGERVVTQGSYLVRLAATGDTGAGHGHAH